MKRYMALGAVLAAFGAGGAALGQKAAAGGAVAAQGDGGLSVLPALVEHDSQPGPLGTYTVANRSAAPVAVKVAPRPWVQAATGKVSANRRGTLPGVSVSESSFTLAPGTSKDVLVSLNATPSAGMLYGALEVIGLPTDAAKRKGVVLGYRLISTIRVLPTVPRLSLTAGTAKATRGIPVIPVKNAGNTINVVTGSVTVKGAGGSRSRSVTPVRILPGKTVNLPASGKLSKGSYSAKLQLNQSGKRVLNVTKTFKVK